MASSDSMMASRNSTEKASTNATTDDGTSSTEQGDFAESNEDMYDVDGMM